MARRQIEREFGVPFPGEILPPERWTQCALKRLPAEGPLGWSELFGRSAAVVLDLGCGNGRFLIGSALWRPDYDHLGLDVLPVVVRYATRRANRRGLNNVRFAVGEAHAFLARRTPPGSVAEIHLYHPQPYHDPAEAGRRLVTPRFLALVHRSLAPGGQFFLQTDNAGYWGYLRQVVPALFELTPRERSWDDAPKGRTRREIVGMRRRLQIHRGQAVRRDLTADEVERIVAGLPPPRFDAGQPAIDVDRLEDDPLQGV